MSHRRRWLFAEFVVVVLGVLAALGVDALVSRVNDARRAEEYKVRLVADLRADAAFFADRSAWHERLIGYSDIAHDVLDGVSTGRPADQEFLAAFMASNRHTFISNNSTWEDLLNTGGLSLFDLETRSRLTQYYTELPTNPVTWDLPNEYRDRVRRLTRPEQIAALNHVECAFRGLFDNRSDLRSDPDPKPQDCTTSLEVGEARQLLNEFRGLSGIEGDLNYRMSAAMLVVENAGVWVDQALELADYLDSL